MIIKQKQNFGKDFLEETIKMVQKDDDSSDGEKKFANELDSLFSRKKFGKNKSKKKWNKSESKWLKWYKLREL